MFWFLNWVQTYAKLNCLKKELLDHLTVCKQMTDVSLFNGISTFVGYLTPKAILSLEEQ